MTDRRSNKVHFATSANTVACQVRGCLTCTTERLPVLRGDRGYCLHCRDVLAEQDRLKCGALYRELGIIA